MAAGRRQRLAGLGSSALRDATTIRQSAQVDVDFRRR